MRVPSNVIWSCIRRGNAYLVKQKFNDAQFTKDPLSITNQHKASDSGIANGKSVSISARKVAAKKTHNRVFDLRLRHNTHHSAKKNSGAVFATQSVKSEVNRLAKVVTSLQGISDNKRKALLGRVHRLHTGNKLHQKKNVPAARIPKALRKKMKELAEGN